MELAHASRVIEPSHGTWGASTLNEFRHPCARTSTMVAQAVGEQVAGLAGDYAASARKPHQARSDQHAGRTLRFCRRK